MDSLIVYLNDIPVGRLTDDSGRMSFSYDRDYAADVCNDVMSTTVYPEVARRLAMKIDGEYAFRWITRAKFLRMATKSGLSPRMMGREIDRMLRRIGNQAPIVAQKLSVRFPSPCYERIVKGILDRCRQLENKENA